MDDVWDKCVVKKVGKRPEKKLNNFTSVVCKKKKKQEARSRAVSPRENGRLQI